MTQPLQRYRSRSIASSVVGFSVSFQRDDLLARGLGLEHLRELLLRLARPLLRNGACLAFGGNWRPAEDNFMYDLLRLIRAEQEDNSLGGPDSSLPIGLLYNHVAWPLDLEVTPRIEAQWVNCCRIVRVTQELAGIPFEQHIPDNPPTPDNPAVRRNAAITLSAARRLMVDGVQIQHPDVARPELVPPVIARILLSGAINTYSRGFVPGIFEEAVLTHRLRRPLYILGGFGGAAEVLAKAILGPDSARPPALDAAWHRASSHHAAALHQAVLDRPLPAGVKDTDTLLEETFAFVAAARRAPAADLNTGLDEVQTRELMTTCDIATAVRLVRQGLTNQNNLPSLPA